MFDCFMAAIIVLSISGVVIGLMKDALDLWED